MSVRCAARVTGCDLSYPGTNESVMRESMDARLYSAYNYIGVIYNSVIEIIFRVNSLR